MSSQCHITVVSQSADLHRAVQAACGDHAIVEPQVSSLDDLSQREPKGERQVILVEIVGDGPAMLEQLEPLQAQRPGAEIVLICQQLQMDLVLRAMRMGVRHCLVSDQIPQELLSIVRETQVGATGGASLNGELITVISAGGGCGATTLAVNIASELHLSDQRPTAIIDLDFAYGAVASHLSVEGEFGIQDVLDDRARIDQQLVRSTATSHASGLDVFLSPFNTPTTSPAVKLENLDAALCVFRQIYGYIVIDAPRLPLDVAAELVRSSDSSILAMELTVPHLRTGRQLLGELRARGVSVNALRPVGCRYKRRGETVTLKDAAKTLGGLPVEPICNEFETVNNAQMYGKSLAESSPRSKLRKEIQTLALSLKQSRQAGAA